MHLKLEFEGGSDQVVHKQKCHELDLPSTSYKTLRDLIVWVRDHLVEKEKSHLLLSKDTVRPGVLVLINDIDWEVLSGLDTELTDGDTITFLSTIHGG